MSALVDKHGPAVIPVPGSTPVDKPVPKESVQKATIRATRGFKLNDKFKFPSNKRKKGKARKRRAADTVSNRPSRALRRPGDHVEAFAQCRHKYRPKMVMHIWMLAFNLMQLFFYRRLKKARRGRPVTDTFTAVIRSMCMELGLIQTPVPWELLPDSG